LPHTREGPKSAPFEAIVLCGGKDRSGGGISEEGDRAVVMIGTMPCKLSSEVHVDGRRIATTGSMNVAAVINGSCSGAHKHERADAVRI
jgi:hypothetical protein